MDVFKITGFLSALLDIGQNGKGFLFWIRKRIQWRKISNCKWDSADPTEELLIDKFKSSMLAEYREHFFTDDEINEIISTFCKQDACLNLSLKNISVLKKGIRKTLENYNDYIKKQMSPGERILHNDSTDIKKVLTELLERDRTVNTKHFLEAVEDSKENGLANIESLINHEYEIDRSSMIDEIRSRRSRFISIIGSAGSGKSVVAQKLVEKEKYVLYMRADSFAQKTSLSELWNCELSDAIDGLNNAKCFIFIDALEFIVDCRNEKWTLIQKLYQFAKKHDNVYIITTCRTEDQNALVLKLQKDYRVETYEVQDLSAEEIVAIAEKYPIIRKMANLHCYSDLLKSPFYINLIVSKMPENYDIQDENAFRQTIWNQVICLADRAKEYGLTSNEIRRAVEEITFNRAKRFETGIHQFEINEKVLHALISEGIVAEKEDLIRLKYDIYEDICFEQLFDRMFDSCKGDYTRFFEDITDLGRCAYRRYQIWISNKLFLKDNREKFIYSIMKGNQIPEKWNEQTEIGIVKSKYCAPFFEEYFAEMFSLNKLEEFLNIINLYAFEARIFHDGERDYTFLQTNPVGRARSILIVLIHRNQRIINGIIDKQQIISLCKDYAEQTQKEHEASVAACEIIQNYIDLYLKDRPEDVYYQPDQHIIPLLKILYQMADENREWIQSFWERLIQGMKNPNHPEESWVTETARETIKNACVPLIKALPEELCQLADALWVLPAKTKEEQSPFEAYGLHKEAAYGLSNNASDYYFQRNNVDNDSFLWGLFGVRPGTGLLWAISFINHVMDVYAQNHDGDIDRLEIWFSETGEKKQYIGTPDMWMIGIEEYHYPMLISDTIYVLRKAIINIIKWYFKEKDKKKAIEFAESIKRKIYTKSNNIALLTIIEAIGLTFQRELPGYAVDLVSNLSLIYLDFHRYRLYAHNPTRELLEQQIQQSIGVPFLHKRYELDPNCNMDLQCYMLSQQLNAEHEHNQQIQDKCNQILDYLYSITTNEGEEAQQHLQIQKMDYRKAELKKIDENIYAVEPAVTGEAKKIVEQYDESKKASPTGKIEEALQTYEGSLINADGKPNFRTINNAIDTIIDGIKEDELAHITYENTLIHMIAIALADKDIESARREKLCSIWVEGLNRYFQNDSFSADNKLLSVLFHQLDIGLGEAVKNKIKKLMIDALLYSGTNGMIDQISDCASNYLNEQKPLAKAFYNTIMLLAEDEMKHQYYNAEYIRANGENTEVNYIPNRQPRLAHIDYRIKEEGGQRFPSQREEIIKRYLFNEEQAEINITDINRFDIALLCYVSNCGLDFDDQQFAETIHKLLCEIIDIWHSHKSRRNANDIIDVSCVFEVAQLLQREINHGGVKAYKAIDLLFDEIPFELFTSETVEFYYDAFNCLRATYFDAYENAAKREDVEKILRYTEEKVKRIKPEEIGIKMYKPLIFAFTRTVHNDWKKCKTRFSYKDKAFLNDQFSKYGMHHVKEMVFTIYMFHVDELLPEILTSLFSVFNEARKIDNEKFNADICEMMVYIDQIILDAYMHHIEEIKKDNGLIEAFEGILSILVQTHNPQAAIILDEFRIH